MIVDDSSTKAALCLEWRVGILVASNRLFAWKCIMLALTIKIIKCPAAVRSDDIPGIAVGEPVNINAATSSNRLRRRKS
jgi:hypothetical protein